MSGSLGRTVVLEPYERGGFTTSNLYTGTTTQENTVEEALANLEKFQRTHNLDGISVRQIIGDARKY